MKSKIMLIAGARPNFMKVAPLLREFEKHKREFEVMLVHTGQHYDKGMSDVFFRDLGMRQPDIHLDVGSASHAEQTARVMMAFEKVVLKEKPDTVVVVGDVNSTVACSLVAAKLGVRVAHVEAGLRSFDRAMPEEINRIVTDSLSDLLFVSEESGLENLKREGVPAKRVRFAGNVMIDTLRAHLPVVEASDVLLRLGLDPKGYGVLTLHRPSNVDSRTSMKEILQTLKQICKSLPVVYPIHPRTRKMLAAHRLDSAFARLSGLTLTDPLGYVDFIQLVKNARFVLTDSGGIQEETTVLGVPCLTMRDNTERPVTITTGSNVLVGRDHKKIMAQVNKILRNRFKTGGIPKYWDGKAAPRIVRALMGD